MSSFIEGFGRRRSATDTKRDLADQLPPNQFENDSVQPTSNDLYHRRNKNDPDRQNEYNTLDDSDVVLNKNLHSPINFDELIDHTEKMREKINVHVDYDLKNELGTENRFDKIAFEAQMYGSQYGERTLVSAGTELADLIRTIPYNHDKFSIVIAKARDLEKRIEKLKNLQSESFTCFDEKNGTAVSFYLRREKYGNVLSFEILLHTPRTSERSRSKLHSEAVEFLKKILNYSPKKDDIEYQKQRYSRATGHQEHHYDLESGAPTYFNELWEHENGEDYGYRDLFFLKDAAEAELVWSRLKKKFQHEPPAS